MYRNGFQNIILWAVLLIVFGPLAAAALTESADTMVAQLSPYLGLAGMVLLVVLALRMFFR